ncbi:hypothetical protein GCM10017764_19850 [Sphingobacterium griseoflavum]|uniref:Prealbumin-like fold domain-containing protein n=1 Tax=Sphingobacterium griseoflavum TaxID=1474952 RepID=A0ABQ3HZU2_9SPHI|nr:hypothetical protein GCM10017764_19850 [Sphingobacterium griseoflavum]
MFSCKKTTNVALVDVETTGALRCIFQDDDGRGIAGAKVYLYDNGSYAGLGDVYFNSLIDSVLTDQQGIVYFQNLLPKSYLIRADSVPMNRLRYRTAEYMQAVAGVVKERVVKVSDFSGTLRIRLFSYYDYTMPLANLSVVAYPSHIALQSDNLTDYINSTTLKGTTDAQGYVSIKVPSNITYNFVIYNPKNSNMGFGYGVYEIRKGEINDITLYSYPM